MVLTDVLTDVFTVYLIVPWRRIIRICGYSLFIFNEKVTS